MTPQPAADTTAITTRYQDGYRIARALNGLGQFCKIVAGVVGGLIVLGLTIMGVNIASQAFNPVGAEAQELGISSGNALYSYFFIGVLIGGTIFLVGWVIGVFIAAQGQLLKASLDAAVHTSPFLSDAQRLEVMSVE